MSIQLWYKNGHVAQELIRSYIRRSARGLEIGPSYNPIAAKRLGYRVNILDHADTETLKAKYRNETTVDAELIEDVDFVWGDQSLASTIGETSCYEYVVASHVNEHTPDMLGFLHDVSSLLTDNGKLVLAIPDMRRCFDMFRPLASLGPILEANAARRTRHTSATAFDHLAYMSLLNGAAGWRRGDTGETSVVNSLAFADAAFVRSSIDSSYYDFHAWVFVPSSFKLIISDLYDLSKIDMQLSDFRLTDGFEFIAILSKCGPYLRFDRADLMRSIRDELLEYPRSKD